MALKEKKLPVNWQDWALNWLVAFQQQLARRLARPGQTETTENTRIFQQISNRQRDDTLSEEPRN
jgi:hypothetical protein